MAENIDTKVAVITSEMETLKNSDSDQWKAINEIRLFMRKLIPIWTATVLMAASFITGSALTFAGMIIKFSGK